MGDALPRCLMGLCTAPSQTRPHMCSQIFLRWHGAHIDPRRLPPRPTPHSNRTPHTRRRAARCPLITALPAMPTCHADARSSRRPPFMRSCGCRAGLAPRARVAQHVLDVRLKSRRAGHAHPTRQSSKPHPRAAHGQHRRSSNTERRSARRVPRWLSERGRPSGPPRRLKSSRRAAAREGNRTTPGEGSSSTPSRQRATRHARRSRRGEAGACCTRAPRRDDDHCCEGSTPHGWTNRRGGGGGGGVGRREARDARVVPREMRDER